MTSTSPDLPRPNRRGFSRDAYDVAYNHHEAAKTSSRRRTAPSTPIACLQSVRCHRSNHARPRLHAPNARQARPRRACNCTERDRQGDCGRPYQDHGCRPAVAGKRGQIRATEALRTCPKVRPTKQSPISPRDYEATPARVWGALIDRGHAKSGSRSGIPPASQCSENWRR
jgi:hypothetical protein